MYEHMFVGISSKVILIIMPVFSQRTSHVSPEKLVSRWHLPISRMIFVIWSWPREIHLMEWWRSSGWCLFSPKMWPDCFTWAARASIRCETSRGCGLPLCPSVKPPMFSAGYRSHGRYQDSSTINRGITILKYLEMGSKWEWHGITILKWGLYMEI